ncbi:hypothetical protein RAMLITH_21440 [Ramlibacter sp. RBP-2]|uniref:Transporter n=1 Tax=Ramlibacter lithotrophicus TaxID=2606681 RepID=A0A7X6DJP8_9BURK|nr:hypothetical protein [Ramlibacter lithotrophicus]NKE68385.1 hypothetical protein [Ramlibacter lithotrophicus]
METSTGLSPAHWMYLAGVGVIVLTMVLRANVVVPSIAGTFVVILAMTGSPVAALGGIFNASFIAAKELFSIFLVIALMTALLNSLKELRSDVRMVQPFRGVMKNGHVSYLVIALVTYAVSIFFWPTPAVPLVAAVLLPAAIASGLPPLAGAVVIALAGQGMALSSDYVIGVAPGISAKAAGAVASVVADRGLVLSLITGGVALAWAYAALRGSFVPASQHLLDDWQAQASRQPALDPGTPHQGTAHKEELARGTSRDEPLLTNGDVRREIAAIDPSMVRWSKLFAVLTPVAFIAVVLLMVLPKFVSGLPTIKGGDAASLIGGMAGVLMIFATMAMHGSRRMLEASADHVTEGFVFAFRAMGSVLPIAGFFFLGSSETAAAILGLPVDKTPSLLFELVRNAQDWIPASKFFVAYGILLVGMITGIDGSGFSGLPLTGALSGALAPASGVDAATLAAIGQMGAVWTGGGTLIAWSSLIAVAGFARVPVQDAVRALTLPVLAGLAISTFLAVVLF